MQEIFVEQPVQKVNTKEFSFKHGVTIQLNLTRLYNMYDALNKNDFKLLALIYQSSPRTREYVAEHLPSYFSYLYRDMEDYEYNIETTCSSLLYDIENNDFEVAGFQTIEAFNIVTNNLYDFLETEMDMWLKWSFNKHNPEKTPIHLLRYIIGNAII